MARSDVSPSMALQPWTILSVFFITSAFNSAMNMIHVLEDPFDVDDDSYNTDVLISSTDRCLFAQLRSLFDKDVRDSGPPLESTQAAVSDNFEVLDVTTNPVIATPV